MRLVPWLARPAFHGTDVVPKGKTGVIQSKGAMYWGTGSAGCAFGPLETFR